MGASHTSQARQATNEQQDQSADLDPQFLGVKKQKRRKREFSESCDLEEKERLEEENLHTPKRKKLKTTSRYIYETLFINGENSDVKISALGNEWKLHKVYLCQCDYFSSMFCGSWRESTLDFIHMDIPDDNIDVEALKIAFGSLYKDDVMISPARVTQVLAAATLLGLDGLIQQCVVVMKEATSSLTVCSYHQAAQMYGQQEVVDVTLKWLEQNLMSSASTQLLSDIDIDLMTQLVASPDLYVMQVEMDMYTLLKKWLYLKLHTNWDGSLQDVTPLLEAFLKEKNLQEDTEFLESPRGEKYLPVFAALRLQHVINDLPSAKILEEDRIIPQRWLMSVYRQQWLQMVKVEQGHDKGPTEVEAGDFERFSMRCGRVLCKEGEYCWRWTGYSFGLDILVSVTSRLVIFKRNTHSQVCPGGVCLHSNRNLMFKLSVSSLDTLGNARYHKTTGIKKLSMAKDEEVVVLDIDRTVPFPLHISCQFMLFTPRKNYDHMILVRGPKKSTPNMQHRTTGSVPSSSIPKDTVTAKSGKEALCASQDSDNESSLSSNA